MFYGVCREHEKNKEAFQMKLDGVYYPLNDNISWLTTCMKEMKQDVAKIQHATDVARPPSIDTRQPPSIDKHHHTSIDNHMSASIDDSPPRLHKKKSKKDFHTREEIDQEEPSRRLPSVSTDAKLSTSIDMALPASTDINIITSVNIHSGLVYRSYFGPTCQLSTLAKIVLKAPKLTSNTKLDTTACLGAWYAWDQILQTSLEGKALCI
ncbi:hypothetical protein YC2023_066678 [Brassica napus]